MLERYALFGLVGSGVLCGLVLLLAWASRDGAAQAARGWLGALAVAAAWLFGLAASFGGSPEFPPVQSTGKVFWLTAGAAALACAEVLVGPRRAVRLALRAAYAFCVPWFLLSRSLERAQSSEALATVLGLGGALLVAWVVLSRWAERRQGTSVPLVLAWSTALGAGALFQTGTAKVAQFAGILVAVLCAAAVVGRLRPKFVLGAGAAGVVTVLLACLWIVGVWFSDMPVEVALLLACAPLAPALADLGPLADIGGARGLLARLALASLVAVPAFVLAWIQAPPPSPYG
ncbi:MAG TPA: hypothetical protein VMT18_14480 [Planctomycetota bacterium]|nr:hypothetical protein [Planctomycetota bacterium]